MDATAIMYIRDNGKLFNQKLLENIKSGNKVENMSILKDVNGSQLSDSFGNTLLHYAAEYGNHEFAQDLIDLGADVNIQNQLQKTPLLSAVEAYQYKTIEVLLKANANIVIPDSTGQCALGQAFINVSKAGHFPVMNLLKKVTVDSLKENPYVKCEIFHANCPLYYFIWMRDAEVTRVLLEMGSPVDAVDFNCKETALFTAVEELDFENIKLLLKYDADVNFRDRNGKNPLAHIPLTRIESKVLKAVQILISAGAVLIDRTSQVNNVCTLLYKGSREIVRTILQCDIDLLFEDSAGLTSLHYLACNGQSDILKEVSLLNIDINVCTRNEKYTMLHYAIEASNISSVQSLLCHGADVNVKDHKQRTPLYAAINQAYFVPSSYDPDFRVESCVNCVEILLRYGANPRILTEQNGGWLSIFKRNISDEIIVITAPLFINLAVLETSGKQIETFMRSEIESYPKLKNLFDNIVLQIDKMKNVKVDDSMTLFDFFTIEEDRIMGLARNQQLVLILMEIVEEYDKEQHCYRRLHQRFLKLSQFMDWREKSLSASKL